MAKLPVISGIKAVKAFASYTRKYRERSEPICENWL